MARVYQGERTFLRPGAAARRAPLLSRRRGEARDEMDWKTYAAGDAASSTCCGLLAVYALQRLQGIAAAQSAGACARCRPDSAFNTAVSFATNTNWQGYGGETTMSYLTQMLALTVQNFVSAATGMAVLVALIARACAPHRADDRQFLGRPDASARSTSCCRSPSCWRWCWSRRAWCRPSAPIETATLLQPTADANGTDCHRTGAAAGSGGLADRHQATGHQRRRLLQRQLGASVRESHAAVATSWRCCRSC